MSTKECSGVFLFCSNLELFAIKTWFLHAHRDQVSHIFVNNARSKQNNKNPEHSFVDLVK